jgi:tripartite-type tricarboxylate transporter receptor subunit TctC
MISTFRRYLLLAALSIAAAGAGAQATYPSRPIRVLVGFGPGGASDTIVRLYGEKMSTLLKTPVVVDNKPGANQMVAIRLLLQSPPDGYTLYAASKSSLVQNPALRKEVEYDPLKDFSLVGIAATIPAVIFVNVDLPVHSMKELVAYAMANPGKLNYGSAGVGSADHLATEALLNITGAKMVHVPYRSAADEIRESIAGNLHVVISPMTNAVPYIHAGKIRALAVTTPERTHALPDVPTLAETGIKGLGDLAPHTYIALVGPAGMPAAVIARLNDAINQVSAMPDVVARVRDELGSEPATMTPTAFRRYLEADLTRWRGFAGTIKLPD